MGKTIDPTPGVVLDTPEKAFALLAEVTKAIQDETADKEKATATLAEIAESLKEIRLRDESKMRFDVGATKELLRGGIRKAMLSPTKDERLRYLQDLSDDVHIVDGILGPPEEKRSDGYDGYKRLNLFEQWQGAYSDFAKTMDTATAGEGTEWVPTDGLSGELHRAIELESFSSQVFPTFNMPTPVFNYPILKGRGNAYRAVENTNADSMTKAKRTKLVTGKTQFDAEKLMGRIVWTGELDEDSIIAMLPEIKAALVLDHADAKDEAVLDGQPGGTIDTGDDPSGDANDVRMLWDGVRKYCQTNSATKINLGAAWTWEGLLSVRAKLGKAGIRPGNAAWIPGVSVFYKLLSLKDEQNNAVVTPMYAYGTMATILTGEMGRLGGIPLFPSEYIREDLNASGIYDGVTETKTIMPIVNRKGWKFGQYKQIKVRSSDIPYLESDGLVIVTRERVDFQAMLPYATEVAAALGYNITS